MFKRIQYISINSNEFIDLKYKRVRFAKNQKINKMSHIQSIITQTAKLLPHTHTRKHLHRPKHAHTVKTHLQCTVPHLLERKVSEVICKCGNKFTHVAVNKYYKTIFHILRTVFVMPLTLITPIFNKNLHLNELWNVSNFD